MRFVGLGDSLTEGLGDRGPDRRWRGWAALRTQLPEARRQRPDLAAVVAGGDDTLRAGFDVRAVARHLDTTLGSLALDGTAVLTACLPDPGTALGADVASGQLIRLDAEHGGQVLP